MVEIIVPHRVEPMPAVFDWRYVLGMLRLVLRDHDDAARMRSCAHPTRELGDDMGFARVVHALRSVEAQAVQVELADPVACIADEVLAHALRVGAVEIDRLS